MHLPTAALQITSHGTHVIGCTLYELLLTIADVLPSRKADNCVKEYPDDMRASFQVQQGPRCADLLSCNVHSRRCLRRKVWPILYPNLKYFFQLQYFIVLPSQLSFLVRVASRSVTPLRAGVPRFSYSCPSQR